MTSGFEGLSDAEHHLIDDFVRKSSDSGERRADGPILTDDEVDYATARAAFQQVASLVSKDMDSITTRWLTLHRLEAEIKSKEGAIISPPDDMPEDPDITPEKLNKLLIKDEVMNYMLIAGAMIEQLTIELVMQDVVAEGRRSNSQRNQIERMAQAERVDLLHKTGVLDNGEKSETQRAYGLRNDIAHSPSASSIIEVIDNIKADISRTNNVLDMLHEKVYGISLNHRLSDTLLSNKRHDKPD